MNNDDLLQQRKTDHIHHVLHSNVGSSQGNSFDAIQLTHNALPEINAEDIDLRCDFLNFQLAAPYLISSMTGGVKAAAVINQHLAEAAEQLNIAMAVGSQKIAYLTGKDRVGLGQELRRTAPSIPLLGNIGAAQLVSDMTIDDIRHLCDDIDANALILHLNPMQEFFQSHGDTRWAGVLAAIESLCQHLERPVIIKEVGFGINLDVAHKLLRAGAAAIDVAGSGGTNWALVEGAMTSDNKAKEVASTFANWGVPTATAIADIHRRFPDCPIIASGGIRHGLDAAKALHLGASLVAQAGALLPAAIQGTDAVIDHIETVIMGIQATCFATGAIDLAALRALKHD